MKRQFICLLVLSANVILGACKVPGSSSISSNRHQGAYLGSAQPNSPQTSNLANPWPSTSSTLGNVVYSPNSSPIISQGILTSPTYSGLPASSPSSAPIVYPVLTFKGKGTLSHPSKVSGYAIYEDSFVVALDQQKLTLTATALRSDKQSVTDKMAGTGGSTIYYRSDVNRIRQMGAEYENAGLFAVFADSITVVSKGRTYTFDRPFPVYVIPGDAGRYGLLDDGTPHSFTAAVQTQPNSDAKYANTVLVGDGPRTGRFNATITFARSSASGGTYVVHTVLNVDGEKQGGAAGCGEVCIDFPIAKEQLMTINTSSSPRIMSQIWAKRYYFVDNVIIASSLRDYFVTLKLCSRNAAGVITPYACE